MEHATRIDQAALDWLFELRERGADPRTAAEWADWMEQDPAHARAFDRARLLWEAGADLDWADVEAARARARRQRVRPRVRWAGAALAACCALFALAAVLVIPRGPGGPATAEPAVVLLETGIGEVREAVLDDGSTLVLGAASRVEAALGPDARRLRLLEGSAEFSVAHDPARPFVVEARHLQARAVGTRFRVHERADRSLVEVTGGRVRVSLVGVDGAAPIELGAGEAAAGHHRALRVVQRAGPAEHQPWSGTEMLYRDEPLSNLVADLNRHAPLPYRLGPGVNAETPITGRWRMDARGQRIPELLAAVGLRLEPRADAVLLHPAAGAGAGE